MDRGKRDFFKSGEYICIADEWININASYMFDDLCWHIYTKNTKFLDLGFHKEEDDYWVCIYLTGIIIIIPLIEKVVFVIIKGINASV